jgi:hypothetical protein
MTLTNYPVWVTMKPSAQALSIAAFLPGKSGIFPYVNV